MKKNADSSFDSSCPIYDKSATYGEAVSKIVQAVRHQIHISASIRGQLFWKTLFDHKTKHVAKKDTKIKKLNFQLI